MDVEFDGIVKANEQLESLLTTDHDMEKAVQDIVRSVLKQLRNDLSNAARSNILSDPRDAYKAVRYTVYKRILGGNVNILSPRRARSGTEYRKAGTLQPHQRGGNRCPRTQRTEDLDSYYGKDRGFVLRFLNTGTGPRTSRYGNRGSIEARNWFNSSINMDAAAEQIGILVDAEIKKRLNS